MTSGRTPASDGPTPAPAVLSKLKRAFDGTWRPEYGPPGPDQPPDRASLADGIYECFSCRPPYRVPADELDHAVGDHPRFDTVAVIVVDSYTVRQVGRRDGAVVYESTTTVSADGQTRIETWPAAMPLDGVLVPVRAPLVGPDTARRPVMFATSAIRVGAPEADAHLVSGRWKVVAMDLVDHDEDTVYAIEDGALSMSDRLGRSFSAPLDGKPAPYVGDPRVTSVSVRAIDERTIEETDLKDGDIVQTIRWQVDRDGWTMRVRFDDGHGHVMEQSGHRVPEPVGSSSTELPITR